MFKKLLALALSAIMVLGIGTTAFASDVPNVDFNLSVSEVAGIRTSVTSDETSQYIVVYDSIQNTMQVSIKDLETGSIVEGETIEAKALQSSQSARSTIHQDTFSNYEYDVYTGSPNEWRLERPKGSGQGYFMTYENSSNTTQLNSFFDKVNILNDKEWTAVSLYGVSLISAVGAGFASALALASGGTLTPAAIAAVVAATGATGATAIAMTAIGTQCNVCELAYWNALNSTNNTHY
ncbi:hypothetical protein C162_01079 [Paenibacillus sp. FSL R7-269]|uniref:geobacillin-26 family protein n=2 Tax=unclassified Paenibacillus TaxID=185978 RepID=UPI0003E279B4|nr:geobacillin-26 family protein [Paenibacillus sp. FSL R7-269]ETT56524.1 hypothetical protein C162_01079 [Paenibacillus sp. FSL R7-269]